MDGARPGRALVYGVGTEIVHGVIAYAITPWALAKQGTYGALGLAAALLLCLFLISRLVVSSAVVNATLWERSRTARDRGARPELSPRVIPFLGEMARWNIVERRLELFLEKPTSVRNAAAVTGSGDRLRTSAGAGLPTAVGNPARGSSSP